MGLEAARSALLRLTMTCMDQSRAALNRLRRGVRSVFASRNTWHRRPALWLGVAILVALVAAVSLRLFADWPSPAWMWLTTAESSATRVAESGSTTVRNLGLVVGGALALWIAYWRGRVADKQADTALQSLLNDRYQQGVAMIRSDQLALRFAGIDVLRDLARDHADSYYRSTTHTLSNFVRNPTPDEALRDLQDQREDVQVAVAAISSLQAEQLRLGRPLAAPVLWRTDFSNAHLPNASLRGAFLRGCVFRDAHLYGIDLTNADMVRTSLERAHLAEAKLVGTNLMFSDLTQADLSNADLTSAVLAHAEGLTQDQLDRAHADRTNPPKLIDVRDALTGEELVWDP